MVQELTEFEVQEYWQSISHNLNIETATAEDFLPFLEELLDEYASPGCTFPKALEDFLALFASEGAAQKLAVKTLTTRFEQYGNADTPGKHSFSVLTAATDF
jgi:hypothetical protein